MYYKDDKSNIEQKVLHFKVNSQNDAVLYILKAINASEQLCY